MDQETLTKLWEESKTIAQSDGVPRYVAFEKRIRDRTLNECCSIVCFYCRDDVPVQRAASGIWQHVFFGEDKARVLDRSECKAANIRDMM